MVATDLRRGNKVTRMEKIMKQPFDPTKKHRERELIQDFVNICSDFAGWEFQAYSENPDMAYVKDGKQLGFDSVIISDDQASVQCVYSPQLCRLSLPANLPHDQRLNQIEIFFANKLFTHLRKYSIPTVLVFTLVDTTSTSFADITAIAKQFELPRLESFNILAYYICDNTNYIKIASA